MAAETPLTPEEKLNLITRDLQEVVGKDELLEILKQRDITIYWGTAPTGKPHLGYFVPMTKLADFLKAGCKVIILLADLHAFLDNMKSTWELLEHRTKYYEYVIKEILRSCQVPLEKLHFVRGTSYQLQSQYTLDVYRMAALTTINDAKHAGAEVVKQDKNPKLSGTMYPILQALDEEHLKVDAQFGGVDQRKIFMFARDFLPKLGYSKRCHLMNFLVPGLGKGGKMSASDPNSKIDFTDTNDQIRDKIRKAFSVDGQKENNGILAILKFILFKKLEREQRPLDIDRPEQYGGRVIYKTYEEVEEAFVSKQLGSADLKSGVADELVKLITPLREFLHLPENIELMAKAYPAGSESHGAPAAAAAPATAAATPAEQKK